MCSLVRAITVHLEEFKVYENPSMIFHHFHKGKQLLRLTVCDPFKIESTRKGKNLLIGEQILFFGEFT